MCSGLEVGQALEQRVDARAGGRQARLERIAFLREQVHLFGQQRVGALQLLVAHEQALDSFDEGVDLRGAGHAAHCKVRCQEWRLKSAPLVPAVWFACRSSTGSRTRSPVEDESQPAL